jgi:CBS domain-containing protein
MHIAAILRHKGHDIISVPASMPLSDVVCTLARHRIGAVLVREGGDAMLGIVSERDVVRVLCANGAAALEMTAGQVMTRAVHTLGPHATVAEAMEMMTSARVRHLPVLEAGALVGMISIGDVVKARIGEQEAEVDSLKAYVAGAT